MEFLTSDTTKMFPTTVSKQFYQISFNRLSSSISLTLIHFLLLPSFMTAFSPNSDSPPDLAVNPAISHHSHSPSLLPFTFLLYCVVHVPFSPLCSIVPIFTPFTPLFYNSPLILALPLPLLNDFIISFLLSITHLLSLTHLLLILSLALSTFLLHLMPFYSFSPPRSSHLISYSPFLHEILRPYRQVFKRKQDQQIRFICLPASFHRMQQGGNSCGL